MIPRGAPPLIALRKSGKKPESSVWINYGNFSDPWWWKYTNSVGHPEILIRPEDSIEKLDFRCVYGLKTILFFSKYNREVIRLYERLTEYASEILVLSPDFDDDIGWFWIKGLGRVEFGDTHYIADLKSAEDDRANAARKGDNKAYQAAADREQKIREEAPWLNS